MIVRIWHGWTTALAADRYQHLLLTTILPGIEAKNVAGYRGARLLRRTDGDEIEFVTMMRFDSLDAVRAFAGADYETAYVPGAARELLSRFDPRAQHYDLAADREDLG